LGDSFDFCIFGKLFSLEPKGCYFGSKILDGKIIYFSKFKVLSLCDEGEMYSLIAISFYLCDVEKI